LIGGGGGAEPSREVPHGDRGRHIYPNQPQRNTCGGEKYLREKNETKRERMEEERKRNTEELLVLMGEDALVNEVYLECHTAHCRQHRNYNTLLCA